MINVIKKDGDSWSWYGSLIDEAKFELKSHLLWSVHFIRREGNQAAHVMAKLLDLSLLDESDWTEEISSVLTQIVIAEMIL